MEISAVTSSVSIQSQSSLLRTEKINTHSSEVTGIQANTKLTSGQLSSNTVVDQQELFAKLAKRLEEKSGITIEISININEIKANLGSVLAGVLDRADSNTLTNLLSENITSSNNNQVNSNVRERYINALITAGINDDGIFGSTGGLTTPTEVRDSVESFSTTQTDGRQLLFNFLIEELDTPRDEVTAILSTLQSQPFQAVA